MINPPTDNLYKFCAIVGLILIVFNSYYNFEMLFKTEQNLIMFSAEQEKYTHQLKNFYEKAKNLNKELDLAINLRRDYIKKQQNLIDEYKRRRPDKDEIENLKFDNNWAKDYYEKNTKFIDSLKKAIGKEDELLKLKQIEINTKQELIKLENRKNDKYSKYLFIGVVLGLVLTIYGFKNWIRIQKIIDRNLGR